VREKVKEQSEKSACVDKCVRACMGVAVRGERVRVHVRVGAMLAIKYAVFTNQELPFGASNG